MWTTPFISVRKTLHVHLNSWAAFNTLHYVEDSGHTLRFCPLYALITPLTMVSTASHTLPVGPFSGFVCLCKQRSFEIISKGNDESSSRRFTGPPKLSRLAAASLSRKKNTKRIKECEQRMDETLAIRVWGIRQNAGWQRHVLLFCSLKARKKSCLFKSETGWQHTASACTHQSEWVTGSISPSAAHVGTSVTLSSEQWSVVAPIAGKWQIAGILSPSNTLNVCFTCGVICRHFQMLKKEYYSFIFVCVQPACSCILLNLNVALRDPDLNYISSLPLSIIGVLRNVLVFLLDLKLQPCYSWHIVMWFWADSRLRRLLLLPPQLHTC